MNTGRHPKRADDYKIGDQVKPDYSTHLWTVAGHATNTNGTRCVIIERDNLRDLILATYLTPEREAAEEILGTDLADRLLRRDGIRDRLRQNRETP